MSSPFLILSLPRSRTSWISNFLSYADWHCGHDELRYIRQFEDISSWFSQPMTGTVETAAAPFWRLALHLKPDLKLITIRRDPKEAAESAYGVGLGNNIDELLMLFQKLDLKLGQIEHRTGCKSFNYEDLKSEDTCAELFESVIPYKHDSVRWKILNDLNIQINAQTLQRYTIAYSDQLNRLNAMARQKSLSLLHSKQIHNTQGITIDFESLSTLLSDGKSILKDHCVMVGESPDNFINKNLSLLQRYENLDALQIAVARCNGRIFGYLGTTIGESLEVTGRLSGCHTAFYASPDFPGLGLKLLRKANEGLRDRGVFEVVMRDGIRGSGGRISTLYRRIGAEPFGTYHRLQLGET